MNNTTYKSRGLWYIISLSLLILYCLNPFPYSLNANPAIEFKAGVSYPNSGTDYSPENKLNFYHSALSSDTISVKRKLKLADSAISYALKQNNTIYLTKFRLSKVKLLFSATEYNQAAELCKVILRNIKGKRHTKDSEYRLLYMEALGYSGLSNIYLSEHNKAIEIFSEMVHEYGDDSISIPMSMYYNGMGIIFADRGFSEMAAEYFTKSLNICIQLDDPNGQYLAYSNLGVNYLGKKRYEEALECFMKAKDILNKHKIRGEKEVYVYFYIGTAYTSLKKYDLAEEYLLHALQTAKERDYTHIDTYIKIQYAELLRIQRRLNDAERVISNVLKDLQSSTNSYLMLDVSKLMAEVYIDKEEYEKACSMLVSLLNNIDTLHNVERDKKIISLKSEYDNYKLRQEKLNKEKDYAISQAKLKNTTLWAIMLSVAIFVLILFLIFLIRRIYVQHQANNILKGLLSQNHSKEKERMETLHSSLEQELDQKNKELASNSLLFLRLNSISEDLSDKLKYLRGNSALKGKDKLVVLELEALAEQISMNKGWGEFEMYFNQIDKGFFTKLTSKFPSLTPNEKRLCALFSLHLTSKEIATLTQKSTHTLSMSKIRLKKKLNIENDEDMYTLLENI